MRNKSLISYIFSLILLMTCFADARPVGTQEIEFTIPSSDRTLVAEIYYPTESGQEAKSITQGIRQRREFARNAPLSPQGKPYPLVIFSHGWQGDRFGHAWLAETLVDAGYIVAMIDHAHNTSYENSAEFIYTSMWQRPLDMSAFLDYLLQHPDWSEVIDDKRIAAGGFSLGGLTALWLAGIQGDPQAFKGAIQTYALDDWPESVKKRAAVVDWDKAARSYFDPRIRTAFALSPDLGQGFKPFGLSKVTVPVLIIAGTQDFVTPFSENAAFYAAHINGAELLKIKGAGHFIFLNTCSLLGRKMTPHLCQDSSQYRLKIHKEVATKIIEFLKKSSDS